MRSDADNFSDIIPLTLCFY